MTFVMLYVVATYVAGARGPGRRLLTRARGRRRSPGASPPATRGITEPESLVAVLDRAIAFRLSTLPFKFTRLTSFIKLNLVALPFLQKRGIESKNVYNL